MRLEITTLGSRPELRPRLGCLMHGVTWEPQLLTFSLGSLKQLAIQQALTGN